MKLFHILLVKESKAQERRVAFNVEDSSHDATHVLGNGVLVTNTSGYPKAIPHEASILWSAATRRFITLFAKDPSRLNAARC